MKRAALTGLAILLVALPVAARPKADAGAAAIVDAGAHDAAAADAAAASDAGAAPAADTADAGTSAATDAGAPAVFATCVEHVPPGAHRPSMKEDFPYRGTSGYAADLKLVLSHGKGEKVLPEGFHLQAGSDAAKELEKAGFVIPDPTGGVGPKVEVAPGEGATTVTTVTIPLVPLPTKPGRNVLEVPPLPIAVARANNEYVTLCTQPHRIQIEDPTTNELDPKVKKNPPGRQQREDWPLARNLAMGVPAALALAVGAALLDRWWRKRPKKKPEPPRIPPWITALEELDRIRRSSLLEEGKHGEHFDQVSDAIRRYLGARYGFETLADGYNGLETTTQEMLELLERVRPPVTELVRIKEFLGDCDLVKFARFTPTSELCLQALERGETIVRRTTPVMQLASPPPPPNDAGAAPPPASSGDAAEPPVSPADAPKPPVSSGDIEPPEASA